MTTYYGHASLAPQARFPRRRLLLASVSPSAAPLAKYRPPVSELLQFRASAVPVTQLVSQLPAAWPETASALPRSLQRLRHKTGPPATLQGKSGCTTEATVPELPLGELPTNEPCSSKVHAPLVLVRCQSYARAMEYALNPKSPHVRTR